MRTNTLGKTGIRVSALCLGSMTWGHQNTEEEAFAQMDYAADHDINFIDTAEMYSIPTQAKTYGLTETIIGRWLKSRGSRENIVIASKVAGPSRIKHIRGGKARLDASNIRTAIEGSLRRLGTDYIDLYQLHWPDRNTNVFGKLNYQHNEDEQQTPIHETLTVLSELVQQGKVRAIGLSNETAWGAMTFLQTAKEYKFPRICSIQNPYNLLNRTFEMSLAEIAHREDVGLLAYSPLAFGALTGKYRNAARPQNARMTLFKEYKRYFTPSAVTATEKYCQLAEDNGLTPAQLALAFVNQQGFLTSNIIGTTSMQQLMGNIKSVNLTLSPEIINSINAIHTEHTFPAP